MMDKSKDIRHYDVTVILKYITFFLITLSIWGLAFVAQPDWTVYISVAIVTFSLFLGLQSRASLPFSIFSIMYVLLFFSGQLLISGELVELHENYSSLNNPAAYEFAIYFLAASTGFLVLDKLLPKTDSKTSKPDLPPYELAFIWFMVLVTTFAFRDISHPSVVILTKVVLPMLGFALLISVKSKLASIIIFGLTVLPVISSRHTSGQFLAWAILLCFVMTPYVESSVSKMTKQGIALFLLAILVFALGTVVKYDVDKLVKFQHYITRILLVQSHSTAKLVDIRNENPSEAAELYGGGAEYWLSLVPGVSKPVNAGDVTYNLSRREVTKSDLPYLPPGAPGELYITLGMFGMIVGALLHGGLISMLWYLANKYRNMKVHASLLTGATVFLCGIGTPSLYGKINAIKESFYVMVALVFMTTALYISKQARYRLARLYRKTA